MEETSRIIKLKYKCDENLHLETCTICYAEVVYIINDEAFIKNWNKGEHTFDKMNKYESNFIINNMNTLFEED